MIGQIFEEVYGLALCRGDLDPTDCAKCVIEASGEILKACPHKTGATIWYDHCLLRYNDNDFFGRVVNDNDRNDHVFRFASNASVGEPLLLSFGEKTRQLFDRLSQNASADHNNNMMYASGEIVIDGSRKMYGLAQCTRDLSGTECKECLDSLIESIWSCCSGKRGVRIVPATCYIRYELYPFLNMSYFD